MPTEPTAEPTAEGADGTSTTPPSPASGRRRVRWGAVGGLAALAYVVAVAVDALVLAADGGAYTDLHRRLDGLGPRLVLALVLVGALGHLLDGGRRLVVDGPRLAPSRRAVLDARARLVVAFLVGALGVPLAAAVLWPATGGAG